MHKQGRDPKPLAGKTLALIFEKPSTRTRVSFEAGIAHLGGSSIYLGRNDSQLSRNEPISDTARVLARYVDGIVIRTFGQEIVVDMARYADIPVINGLTDTHHPCQVLSDLQTVQERFGRVTDLKIAWIGDGNNMANSWITAALRLDFDLVSGLPAGIRTGWGPAGSSPEERAAGLCAGRSGLGRPGRPRGQHRRLGLHGPGRRGPGAEQGFSALSGE